MCIAVEIGGAFQRPACGNRGTENGVCEIDTV